MKLLAVKLLDSINSPDDLKKLNNTELNVLSGEIRNFLVENVSKTGGHLASNLGVVELTLAVHSVFNSPNDKIVWDVGHQSYVHKIVTGRKEMFACLRKMGGMSGFPKTNESSHDCFNTGHSSTSISAALGMARARDIKHEKYSIISVIGDGALTGGMAFEALNDAGRAHNDLIVILNDNEMSISKNVGALSRYLNKIRTEPVYFKVKEDLDTILNRIPVIGNLFVNVLSKVKNSIKHLLVPGAFFEELGFTYLGPVDGHDINDLKSVLFRSKSIKGPVIIHVCTQKGKGYYPAEENPHLFHGVSPFLIETGEALKKGGNSFSKVFSEVIVRLAKSDESIVAVTAAMPQGTGLEEFSQKFPHRFFDVGIAEQHAVTMSAGLAQNGLKPVFAVYSSFLQRSYDQILHDVAMQNLHVVFAIDRAGIVGEDGETHQGIYDTSYLSHIPNITEMAPADYNELSGMLEYALMTHTGPIAIRYPRGDCHLELSTVPPIELGKGVLLREGNNVSILAFGEIVGVALEAAERLEKEGIFADVINIRFAKPLDKELILASALKTGLVYTLEDNVVIGGFGSSVLALINENCTNIKVRNLGLPDQLIEHGSRQDLLQKYGLDSDSVASTIMTEF